MTATGTVAERPLGAGLDSFSRLALANIGVAVAAFGVASAMAIMQALSRANLDLPFRSAGMYYMSVTAHGTLMALVFTTFFIMGFGYVVAQHSLGAALAMRRTAWVSFWIAVLGTLATVAVILAGKATVLYTFYPPLKAHPLFYIGLTLVVVGSWGWALVMLRALRRLAPRECGPPDSAVRVRLCGDDHRVAAGHDRRGRGDAAAAHSLVARLDADDRSGAGADAVLVVRPSAGVFLAAARLCHLVRSPACRPREASCSASRSGGSSSRCSSCCRRPSASTTSSWIRASPRRGSCFTPSTRC